MEFKTHLQVLRMCRTQNITKGAFIRHIYQLIEDHKGKDFKDLDDFFSKLYPKRDLVIQPVPAGVNVRRRPRRESAYYKRKFKT